MLKKLLTGCLTIAMAAALATTAMADAKVTGKVRTYFGQYTPAGEDVSGRFANAAEGNIGVMGTVGDITGFMEVEVRDAGAKEFNASKVWAQMKKDALTLKIGNDANGETVGMQGVGKSSDLAGLGGAWNDAPNGGYQERDHLKVGYQVGDIALGLTLYSWDGASSGNQLTAGGMAGPVSFKFASTSLTMDSPDTADTEKGSQSNMHVGVLYPIGEMAISLDYSTLSVKNAADIETAQTYMRLGFSMKGAGPGTLAVVYDTEAQTYDGENVYGRTWINLGYDIAMGQGSGLEVLYLTNTKTYEDSSVDAETQSFIGLGLYAFF